MPRYLNCDEFLGELGAAAADLYDDGGLLNCAWAAADLEACEAELETTLAGRYALPVPDERGQLRGLLLDLAAERAWSRRASADLPQGVREAAARARERLAALAAGQIRLAAGERRDLVAGNSNPPACNRSRLAGY